MYFNTHTNVFVMSFKSKVLMILDQILNYD